MNRRELLRLLGLGGGFAMAGCLGDGESRATEPRSREDSPTATDSSRVRQWARQADANGPVRAEGEAVIVEETLTDEPGYEDEFEYFPNNRTVRVVTATSGGEPTAFESQSFEEWGRTESVELGAERAAAVTASRLDVERILNALTTAPPGAERDGFVIMLTLEKTLDSDGEVMQWPVATFPELTRVAPRSVEVTLSLEGDTVTRTIPAYAEYVIQQVM
jgi:hypothetical protein